MSDLVPKGLVIRFDWEAGGTARNEMQVEDRGDVMYVTLNPGLSSHQVERAAKELDVHGPRVVQAWREFTGFQA